MIKDISLHELMYEWTLDDVMKANAVLDMKEAYNKAVSAEMDMRLEGSKGIRE